MKRTILVTGVCIFGLFIFSNVIYAQSGWVNFEGCYCGSYPSAPVNFVSKGSGTSSQRQASLDQMNYWNKYSSIYTGSLGTGLGAPLNNINEVNTFMTAAEALSIYGYVYSSGLYGVAIIRLKANFGGFNGCSSFSSVGCGPFTETDVLINAGFPGGWTTSETDFSKALVQTTALHEIGHAWGAHHVFNISATAANSFSTMNYVYDYTGKYVTRMDANTIRAAYSGQSQSVTDVGIFPFTYGNGQYAGTYTTADSSVAVGSSLSIGRFILQNLGTTTANNVVITFYLSGDTTLDSDDCSIGTVTYSSLSKDSERQVSGISLTVPTSMGNGNYYIAATVRVGGSEDSVGENNSFFLINSGASGPTSLRQVQLWGSNISGPTDCACVSWCDNNYVELSVSPSSISSGGQLQLSYDCYFSDANYYGVPVDIYLALIKDPAVTNNASSTGDALSGGEVYIFTRGLSSNYLFTGRVYEPTWSYVAFPPLATSGTLNIRLSGPSGNYVWATAFRRRDTGQFVRTDLQVENSNQFSIR